MKLIENELWKRGDLEYLMHAAQKVIYTKILENPNSPLIVNLCSRRFGKSYLAAILAIQHCLRHENSHVLIVAPTIKQATDIFTPIFQDLIQKDPDNYIKRMKSEKKYGIGKSLITLTGFLEADSLRGMEADLIIIDEVGLIPNDNYNYIVKQVFMPMLLHSKGKLIFSLTPPETIDHAVVTETFPIAKMLNTFTVFTIYDNPLLDESQIKQAIEMSGGVDSIEFRREYLCEIVANTKRLIIPAFKESEHTIKSYNCMNNCFWISGDVGGIRDKSVILVFGIDITNKKPIVIEEKVFDKNSHTILIGDSIRDFMKQYNIPIGNVWIDCHGQTLVDLHNICGLSISMPLKQDRDSAISRLNAAFFTNDISIYNECKFLIKTLRSAMFNEKNTDFERTDELGHADAVMALVYGFRMLNSVNFPSNSGMYKPNKNNMNLNYKSFMKR
jgi:hypothetical protein